MDKFPFVNQVLKDLRVLGPTIKGSLQYTCICRWANIFAPHLDQEALKDEFDDYCMLSDECVSLLKENGQKTSP